MPIDWLTLGAALLAGLMGGVHCVAMCGGIATGFSAMSSRNSWLAALGMALSSLLVVGNALRLARTPSNVARTAA